MLEWEVVQTGDIIVPKGRNVEAKLLSNGNVEVEGEEKSIQAWLNLFMDGLVFRLIDLLFIKKWENHYLK